MWVASIASKKNADLWYRFHIEYTSNRSFESQTLGEAPVHAIYAWAAQASGWWEAWALPQGFLMGTLMALWPCIGSISVIL